VAGTRAFSIAAAAVLVSSTAPARADVRPETALQETVAERDQPASPAPERSNDPTLFVAGLWLTVIGGASAVAGLLYTTAGPVEYCRNCASDHSLTLGYTALIGGFTALVAGSAFMIVGSLPATEEDDADDDEASAAVPAVTIGPGGAGLRWTF
jgi:hypothetical protein